MTSLTQPFYEFVLASFVFGVIVICAVSLWVYREFQSKDTDTK